MSPVVHLSRAGQPADADAARRNWHARMVALADEIVASSWASPAQREAFANLAAAGRRDL